MTIREANSGDAAVICAIKKQSWIDSYQNPELGITKEVIEERDFDSKRKVERLANNLKRTDTKGWVAVADDKIVGYCTANKGDAKNYLDSIHILPGHKGGGIGTSLINHAFAWLGKEKPISLGVVEYNHRAISWYKKLGFKLGERIEHPRPTYPNGIDMPEIEMIKV